MIDNNQIVPTGTNENNNQQLSSLIQLSGNLLASITALAEQTKNNTDTLNGLASTVADLKEENENRKKNEPVNPAQKKAIRKEISKRVHSLIGIKKNRGKFSGISSKKSKVYGPTFFSRAYNDLYNEFNISTYEEIKSIDFDRAKNFIKVWQPENGVLELSKEAEENWTENHPESSVDEYLERLF